LSFCTRLSNARATFFNLFLCGRRGGLFVSSLGLAALLIVADILFLSVLWGGFISSSLVFFPYQSNTLPFFGRLLGGPLPAGFPPRFSRGASQLPSPENFFFLPPSSSFLMFLLKSLPIIPFARHVCIPFLVYGAVFPKNKLFR